MKKTFLFFRRDWLSPWMYQETWVKAIPAKEMSCPTQMRRARASALSPKIRVFETLEFSLRRDSGPCRHMLAVSYFAFQHTDWLTDMSVSWSRDNISLKWCYLFTDECFCIQAVPLYLNTWCENKRKHANFCDKNSLASHAKNRHCQETYNFAFLRTYIQSLLN